MRSFVESRLGVKVTSSTEVVNSLLVRDSIIARSDGYVMVKKVIREKRQGDLYQVTLDLEANDGLMTTMAADLPARLEAIESDSSRNGINVAIVDEDSRLTALWNTYFTGMLKQIGFRAEVNDPVVQFLGQHLNGLNDLMMNAEIRRIGRTGDRMSANSIIRGRISLARPAEQIAAGSYRAVAQVTCELIGYDTNDVDVSSGYYSYIAASPDEAESMAKQTGLRAAAEELGKQALITNQREYQGGVHHVKAGLVFRNLTNKAVQRKLIVDGLGQINCRIIRSGFMADGSFQVFVEATDYNNLEELKEAALNGLSGVFPQIVDAADSGQAGSTRIVFDL